MSWVYLPPWGIRAVAAVGVLLVSALTLRAVRERRHVRLRRQLGVVLLRALAVGFLLFVMLNPTALLPREVGGKPKLVVLIDTSQSMATRDVSGRSRLGAGLQILSEEGLLGRLAREFLVDVRTFDTDVRRADQARLNEGMATGKASDIGRAVVRAVDDLASLKSHGGAVLLSDGRATTAGTIDAARLALARSVPIWTWCLGGEVPRRDLWIEVAATETLAFAGEAIELSAALHQLGYPNRSFRVDVVKDGQVLQSKEVLPDESGAAPVKVSVTAPDAGEHRYVFRAPPAEGEAEAQNNERSVFLRVVGQKVRVLLAEGQPHWDTKFLVQCLKRRPHVDLTAVYRLGDKRHFAVISSATEERREEADRFPRSEAEMMQYDIIIFGRGCESFFDERTEELVTRFVSRRGGAVVFSRAKAYGGRFYPLAKFEPIVWGLGAERGLRLRPTEEGQDSPIFEIGPADKLEELIARLPALDHAASTRGEKPLAVVLATTDSGQPDAMGRRAIAMASQRYGQGKVVLVNAGGLWRWSFREKGKEQDEFVYAELWMNLLRWLLTGSDLLPGADVSLRSERRYYTDEQTMQFLIRTRGIDPAAYRPRLAIAGEGAPITIEPREERDGAYVAEAGPFAPGAYSVVLHNNVGQPPELATTVEVVSASIENRVLSADPETMQRIAETSGGKAVTARELSKLGAIVKQWRASQELANKRKTLWDKWWLLGTLVCVLGAEWFLRRREGLL